MTPSSPPVPVTGTAHELRMLARSAIVEEVLPGAAVRTSRSMTVAPRLLPRRPGRRTGRRGGRTSREQVAGSPTRQ